MTQLAEIVAAPPARSRTASPMKTDPKQAHLENYVAFRKSAAGAAGPAWLAELRQHAIEAFARSGMPAAKAEAWRWTKHRPVTTGIFALAAPDERAARAVVEEYSFASSAAAEVVIIDGRLSHELSSLHRLPEGVDVMDLPKAAEADRLDLRQHLARHADIEKNPFVALNTAFMSGGLFVRVADGVKLEKPIHLLFVTTGAEQRRVAAATSGGQRLEASATESPPMACPRALVIAADRAEFTIVETYAGPEGAAYFTNAVTEIVAGEDCRIDHIKLNAESRSAFHVATMEAKIGARTVFIDHSCTIGGRMTRNDLNVHLAGEAADATLNGVVLLDGEQHCDNHTLLDHQQPNCPSYELYKHVLDGRASGVFKGQIFVHRAAQKTNAVQNSRSLLLSDTATMNSQPALEIYADDVKCTHGSTTGPLDEGAVFYLNSRGVSTDTARRLLTYAFAADVTRRIKVAPVRERVEHYMARQHGLPTDFRIQDLAEATEDVVF